MYKQRKFYASLFRCSNFLVWKWGLHQWKGGLLIHIEQAFWL